MKAWLWLLAACGSEPPQVTLNLSAQNVPSVAEFARLELRVERCGRGVVNTELARDMTSSVTLEVTPGERFWVWVRGWQFCNPPCQPEGNASATACVCMEPRPQTVTAEACSVWITAAADVTVPLTFAPVAGRCPPPRPAECN